LEREAGLVAAVLHSWKNDLNDRSNATGWRKGPLIGDRGGWGGVGGKAVQNGTVHVWNPNTQSQNWQQTSYAQHLNKTENVM
jgi:hypothetical protein